MKKNNAKVLIEPVENVKRLAILLEENLLAHKIYVHVIAVNYFESYLEFELNIAKGTSISSIETLSKDIALILASPTGEVKIIAPIPGTHHVAIHLPRRTKDNPFVSPTYSQSEIQVREKNFVVKLSQLISEIFVILGYLLISLGNRIKIEQKVKTVQSIENEENDTNKKK